jgi:Predicted membrane protein (DUF2214)
MVRWLLAAVHLLGFGIGLGAVWARARSVASRPLDQPALRRTFAADSWWGVSALLLIGSGLWRLLVGTEKPTGYYLLNHVFYTKMALLAGPDQLPAGAAAGGHGARRHRDGARHGLTHSAGAAVRMRGSSR